MRLARWWWCKSKVHSKSLLMVGSDIHMVRIIKRCRCERRCKREINKIWIFENFRRCEREIDRKGSLQGQRCKSEINLQFAT